MSKDSPFYNCDLFRQADPSTTTYLNKQSASISDIVMTKVATVHGSKEVFLKMWFGWDKIPRDKINTMSIKNPRLLRDMGVEMYKMTDLGRTRSLDYEKRMYEYITQNIVMKNISPNFIPILASDTCNISKVVASLRASNDFARKKELLKKFEAINTGFPRIKMDFIMTESFSGLPADEFFNHIKANPIAKSEYSSILFQFFYIYYVLDAFKIVHNDNHLGNAIIQVLDEPVTLDITVGSFNVKFTTSHIVKLYDWDRSYCEALGENSYLNGFYEYRTIPKFTRGRDFSACICFLSDLDIPQINRLIKRIVDGPIPTENSNNNVSTIYGAVTKELIDWIKNNPDSVFTTDNTTYITIGKRVLESFLPPTKIDSIRYKLGKDKYGKYIYDALGLTNIYLALNGQDLEVVEGWTCHPMYDSKDLDVVKYFTDEQEMKRLCRDLKQSKTKIVYTYEFEKSHGIIIDVNLKDCKRQCPPEKQCNRRTGRCNKIPPCKKECPEGSILNPITGRCNKIKYKKSSLPGCEKTCKKVCPEGSICNTQTGRCNKIKSKAKSKRTCPRKSP